MKTFKTIKQSGLLLVGLFALLNTNLVFADAGDTISNRATINYTVLSTAQPLIESSPTGNSTSGAGNGTDTDFLEDRLINFTVAEVGAVDTLVAPSGTFALAFTVTNNGNDVQDFLLAAVDNDVDTHAGGADDFDATNLRVFVEDGTNPGTYEPTEDEAVFIDELAEGASVTVYIVADIPGAATNTQVAGYALVAQVAAGGTDTVQADEDIITNAGAEIMRDDNGNVSPAGTFGNAGNSRTTTAVGAVTGADDPTVVEVVFNDPAGSNAEDVSTAAPLGTVQDIARNGQHSDSDAYQVQTTTLVVSKVIDTSLNTPDRDGGTIWDSVNTNSSPKAIPTAYIRYVIRVENTGSASGTLTTLSDTIPATLAFDTELLDTACAAASGNNPDGACTTETGNTIASATGEGVQVIYNNDGVGDERATTTFDLLSASVFAGQVFSVDLSTVLPVDVPNNYTAGELKAGESVDIIFNVIVQ